MGIVPRHIEAYMVVRRSSRSNKGQHSKLEGRKKKKVDIVDDDDDGEIRCLCGDNVDDGGFMIQCETCGKWQHGGCMGYEDPDEVQDSYACELCRPDLYKDVSVKEEDGKTEVKRTLKKQSKDKVVQVSSILGFKLISKKPPKRKTPPSEESSDDNSDFSMDDEEPLASRKKPKTVATMQSPSLPSPPPKKSPSVEPRRKPPPINTTRRPSHPSPKQTQRRSSGSATPSTPATLTQTPLVSKFADLPDQKRVPAARIFAKIFEPIDPAKSEALGLAIEHALYSAFATSEPGYGAEYKNKFRNISFNLKDAKNSALRERVLSGDLTPDKLVHLSNEELANQELREQAEKIREEGVAQSVLKVQEGPRIRRTHKGEELVGEEVSAISPTVGSATAPFARAEEMSPSVKGDDEVPASPQSIASNGSRNFSPPPQRKSSMDFTPERKQSVSNFDMSDVWSHHRSPPSHEEPSEPMNLDLDILLDDLPQNQIDDPDIDRMINDDEGNSPPYSPSAYEFEPPNITAQIPPVWSGTLSMPSVANFSAQARFVGGPHSVTTLPWSTILPPHLVIDGRIPIDTTTKYLEAQRVSSTKDMIVIQLEPAEESHREMQRKLYQYFHDRQRYGVLQIQSNLVKDAYLIPLSAEEQIPLQIELMESHEIPRSRTEPTLLAILVIQKNIPIERSPVSFSPGNVIPQSTSPPNNDISKPFSPAAPAALPVQPSTFSPPSNPTLGLEAMGLSAADLAALQVVLIAHPEILSNPQILTNPSILQNLLQQHLGGQQQQRWS
jgi:hypothetical protein